MDIYAELDKRPLGSAAEINGVFVLLSRSRSKRMGAVINIYNAPNSTSEYVVEVLRFTWHSLEVRLDSKIMVCFPQVTGDMTSVGYATIHVKV